MSISNRSSSHESSNSNRNSIASLPGSNNGQQFSSIDGRDLSDINHINYDPAQDPELRE